MPARFLAMSMLAALGLPPTQAQAPPSFEVATIKPSTQTFQRLGGSGGRLSLGGLTLRGIVIYAYGTGFSSNLQVNGGPAWIDRDRFDLEAQAAGNASPDDMRMMLRKLLAERFALKVHTELKDVDVYALVPARNDGKLGPKVQPWDKKCFGREAPPAPADPKAPRCTGYFRPPGMTLFGGSMAALANMLSSPSAVIDRPVVDRTGLTGLYDITFEFPFDPPRPGQAAAVDPAGPSIFTALQEQLGLKLERARGSVDTLVIDQAERPSEN